MQLADEDFGLPREALAPSNGVDLDALGDLIDGRLPAVSGHAHSDVQARLRIQLDDLRISVVSIAQANREMRSIIAQARALLGEVAPYLEDGSALHRRVATEAQRRAP